MATFRKILSSGLAIVMLLTLVFLLSVAILIQRAERYTINDRQAKSIGLGLALRHCLEINVEFNDGLNCSTIQQKNIYQENDQYNNWIYIYSVTDIKSNRQIERTVSFTRFGETINRNGQIVD